MAPPTAAPRPPPRIPRLDLRGTRAPAPASARDRESGPFPGPNGRADGAGCRGWRSPPRERGGVEELEVVLPAPRRPGPRPPVRSRGCHRGAGLLRAVCIRRRVSGPRIGAIDPDPREAKGCPRFPLSHSVRGPIRRSPRCRLSPRAGARGPLTPSAPAPRAAGRQKKTVSFNWRRGAPETTPRTPPGGAPARGAVPLRRRAPRRPQRRHLPPPRIPHPPGPSSRGPHPAGPSPRARRPGPGRGAQNSKLRTRRRPRPGTRGPRGWT